MKVTHENEYLNTCELVNLELHQDEQTRQYYLTATYHFKQGPHTIERVFPHLYLLTRNIPDIYASREPSGPTEGWADLGFGKLPMNGRYPMLDKTLYTDTIIHTEVQKMTLEEVEEKLGYKIKLVSKHENKEM